MLSFITWVKQLSAQAQNAAVGLQGGGLGSGAFVPRPHKKRKGDDSSDEDEWKPSSHSVQKAVRAVHCTSFCG